MAHKNLTLSGKSVRQTRGGETEMDAEPREVGGGQPARDPSRENSLDPKGYRYRMGKGMLPSQRMANRDPED